jgi:uncharacterized protein YlxP (DUF503 family)
MIVGVLKVSLLLRESHSLKDKRRVLKSVKDRVRNRLNASIAEVDSQDLHQRADLAVVTVSPDRTRAETVLSDALSIIDRAPAAERFHTDLEFF